MCALMSSSLDRAGQRFDGWLASIPSCRGNQSSVEGVAVAHVPVEAVLRLFSATTVEMELLVVSATITLTPAWLSTGIVKSFVNFCLFPFLAIEFKLPAFRINHHLLLAKENVNYYYGKLIFLNSFLKKSRLPPKQKLMIFALESINWTESYSSEGDERKKKWKYFLKRKEKWFERREKHTRKTLIS